ncbi:MAG: hypothetical protein MUF07_08690 [Steroidobacteraceae bacterium]|jgi:hypothetical protein|nr:hypothetical protein [Steroidobacteraceae bacterium]
MSEQTPGPGDPQGGFEQRTRQVLEESVQRLDGRTRSRLNQARQRALEAHAARERSPLSWLAGARGRFAPAGAVAVLALLAVVLWDARPGGDAPLAALAEGAAIEDLELLADNDALELAREGDPEFYEWALAEADAAGAPAVGT